MGATNAANDGRTSDRPALAVGHPIDLNQLDESVDRELLGAAAHIQPPAGAAVDTARPGSTVQRHRGAISPASLVVTACARSGGDATGRLTSRTSPAAAGHVVRTDRSDVA